MKIAVLADELLKEELLAQGLQEGVEVKWMKEPLLVTNAEAYIDLLFEPTEEHIRQLKNLRPAMILVNAVHLTLEELPGNFIRFNGWPSFLKRPIMEAAGKEALLKKKAEAIFDCFNRSTEWVTDIPGFVSARVLSMIINEAYFALEENVSSKDEIDTAMKLGTNYPYGPFEWSQKIGLKNIHTLLVKLAALHPRYQPSNLLRKEAMGI